MMKLWAAALTLMTGLAALMIDSAIARSACGAAITATSLSSFEGIEEPTVIYHPSTATFTDDSYVNIVDEGGGVFRYTLRYRPDLDYFDGDRATTNNDRQRAEIKGLGPHQKMGQTFEYTYDWRTDSNFVGTSTFCHIFQLKATDGDDAPPLVTLSLGTNNTGKLELWSAAATGPTSARTFAYADNVWEHAEIIIHTAADNTGFVEASINGDAFKGLFNLPVYRPNATDYRPKWGFYRGINSSIFVGDNYVEDRNVTAAQIVPEPTTAWLLVPGAASLLIFRRRARQIEYLENPH